MTQRSNPQGWAAVAATLTALLALTPTDRAIADDNSAVRFQRDETHGFVKIFVGDAVFAEYVYRDDKILRPYLRHLQPPGGPRVTRDHPPIPGRDAVDHDRMHPGLWLGFGDLGGQDYWRNQAKVRHERFIEEPQTQSGAGAGGFADVHHARAP